MLLSGSSTKLAPCFVGLDKRYVTDVDLTSTTTTGDPEGEVRERHDPPGREELDARLEALRGEVELPIPAASAVKIGGERAYRLQRRGVEVEMPVRRSQVYALDVIAYTGDQVRLGLHVGSGTYVRSIAEALGGHCLTLRRTAVGPFSVDEADPARLVSVAEALGRLPEEALERVPYGLRAQVLAFEAEIGGSPRAAWRPGRGGAREGRARARPSSSGSRARSRSGPSTASTSAIRRSCGRRSRPVALRRCVTFHPHPRDVLGYDVLLLSTLERRLELLDALGVEEVLVVEFTPEVAATSAEEFARTHVLALGAEVVVAGEGFRFGSKRGGDLGVFERLGAEVRETPLVPGVASRRIRELVSEGDVRAAAELLGRPAEVEGIVVSGDARGGTLGFPTANLRVDHAAPRPAVRHLRRVGARPPCGGLDRREPALRGLGAPGRGVPPRLRGRSLRPAGGRRALGPPPRRGRVPERGRTDRPDRPRRRADATVDASRPVTGAAPVGDGWRVVVTFEHPDDASTSRASSSILLPWTRTATTASLRSARQARRGKGTNMAGVEANDFSSPDETRTPDKTRSEIVRMSGATVARLTLEPGWSWSECVKPVVGTESCQNRHVGVASQGRMRVTHDDGTEAEIEAGDAYVIEPGHDAQVVGDEPFVGYEFESAEEYARG